MLMMPNPLAPIAGRYTLPGTEYFRESRDTMSLPVLAGYARAERRAYLVGDNFRHRPQIAVSWPHEYSPYGAGPVERMRENPAAAEWLTGRWDRAAVVSPATAILGLGAAAEGSEGSIRANAAWPIMVGKAKIFGLTAGVDATPHTPDIFLTREQLAALEKMQGRQRSEQLRIWRAERFAEYVRAIAPMYGFINIEDAQGVDLPIIFGALECLRGQCAIWSDDMQGTGVIAAAAILAWAELTGRDKALKDVRVLLLGAGAGGAGVYDEQINHGLRPENILVCDSGPKTGDRPRPAWKYEPFPLHEGRADVDSDPAKVRMRQGIPPEMTVEQFVKGGVDVVINLGKRETLTTNSGWTEWLTRSLRPNPFFLPMTNPDPGITPEMLHAVRADAYYGSGNQVFPNAVNNFTAFGYIGLGALIAMAGGVGPAMTVAAARGILEVAKKSPQFGRDWLVPRADDIELIVHEAGAVAKAAARDNLSNRVGRHPTAAEFAEFDAYVDGRIRFQEKFVRDFRRRTESRGKRYLRMRYPAHFAPFYVRSSDKIPAYHVAPQVDKGRFEELALKIGVSSSDRWADLIDERNPTKLKAKALTMVLRRLSAATKGDMPEAQTALKELEIIVQVAAVSPALGLALALRRTRVRSENLASAPTIFHREPVLRAILEEIPEAASTIYSTFKDVRPPSPRQIIG